MVTSASILVGRRYFGRLPGIRPRQVSAPQLPAQAVHFANLQLVAVSFSSSSSSAFKRRPPPRQQPLLILNWLANQPQLSVSQALTKTIIAQDAPNGSDTDPWLPIIDFLKAHGNKPVADGKFDFNRDGLHTYCFQKPLDATLLQEYFIFRRPLSFPSMACTTSATLCGLARATLARPQNV